MSRPLIGALAIVLLGAGGMLFIECTVGAAPRRAASGMAPPAPHAQEWPALAAAGAPPATAVDPARDLAATADDEREIWRREPAPAWGPWETIVPVNGFGALGKAGPGLRAALDAHGDNRLAQCFGPDDLEPHEEEEGVAVEDETPVLLLRLEALQGAVRIVDATVERRGRATERLLTCAMAELRGTVLTVPGAGSGARHVLRYRLAQASSLEPSR